MLSVYVSKHLRVKSEGGWAAQEATENKMNRCFSVASWSRVFS
jgi:hypothetical protein